MGAQLPHWGCPVHRHGHGARRVEHRPVVPPSLRTRRGADRLRERCRSRSLPPPSGTRQWRSRRSDHRARTATRRCVIRSATSGSCWTYARGWTPISGAPWPNLGWNATSASSTGPETERWSRLHPERVALRISSTRYVWFDETTRRLARLRRRLRQPRPDRGVRVGDGEAETGPLATSWHSNKFLDPVSDGAVCRSCTSTATRSPTRRCSRGSATRELDPLIRGYGYTPYFVEGTTRPDAPADGGDAGRGRCRRSGQSGGQARESVAERPRWPMIVLRTPKGWTCPKEDRRQEHGGSWRSHQVPMGEMHDNPEHVRLLERWMKSYRPEELFDESGRLRPRAGGARADGHAAHERQSARQRRAAAAGSAPARLPRVRRRGARARARATAEATRVMGRFLRDVMKLNLERGTSASSARTRTTRTAGRTCSRSPTAPGWPRPRLRRPPRARRPRDGDALRAPVPGLARGLPADRPARLLLVLRGVHPHHRLDVQPARQVAEGVQRHPVAAADRVAELPAVEPRLAAGPQRLQPPGPGLHRPRRQQEGRGDPRLPAARRQLPAVASPTTACAAATT